MLGLFSSTTPCTTTAPAATAPAAATDTPERRRDRRLVAPRCDIRENADTVVLLADMPGVAADGVDVCVHGDVLTLTGRSAVNEPAAATLWREYAPRDYERVFRLGQSVDAERITATVKDGVLRVELRKRASATPKRITVSAG